jgi:hypothetical protein
MNLKYFTGVGLCSSLNEHQFSKGESKILAFSGLGLVV